MIKIEEYTNFGSFDQAKWPALMEQISTMLYDTIVENFVSGGRPEKWSPRKTPAGGTVPSYRGRTVTRLEKKSGDNWAMAGLRDSRIYDFANEFGAKMSPRVTGQLGKGGAPGSKRFFWYMWRLTGNEMWKWMALKKEGSRLNITLGKRPAFVLPEAEKNAILDLLKQFISQIILPTPMRRATA